MLVALCGLTSLSTIGYIFIDSKECYQNRKLSCYEQTIKQLQSKNNSLEEELKRIQKQQL